LFQSRYSTTVAAYLLILRPSSLAVAIAYSHCLAIGLHIIRTIKYLMFLNNIIFGNALFLYKICFEIIYEAGYVVYAK
jgi:hypothetical protein